MTLFDVVDRYAARRLMGANKRTETKYRRVVRYLGQVVGRLPLVEDLTDDNVAAVMQMKMREGCSPYTVNDIRSKLVSLWTFAAKRGDAPRFPDVDRLAEPAAAPVAWSADQLASVFAAMDAATQPVAGVPGPLWWKTLLSILWDTGERRGAIVNRLPWSCLVDGRLLVPAEVRKGKTRDKLYTLHADTVALCDQVRAFGHDLIVKWDRTDEQLVNRYRTLLKRAGLPHDRKHMFHCIRRSVASHAAASGADATAILDHADPSITRRYYLDPRIVPQPQAVDVLFRPDSPRPAA